MATSSRKKTSARKRTSSAKKTSSASRSSATKRASSGSSRKAASRTSRKTASAKRVSVRSASNGDRDADRRDIERQVSAMFKKAGQDPYETADLLNRKKIRTLNGKPFTARRIWFYV